MTFQSLMPHLYTADVDRAAAFYRDLLGGTQTFQYPSENPAQHVELRIGAATIALSSHDTVPQQGLPAPAPGHPMELTGLANPLPPTCENHILLHVLKDPR